MKNFINPNLPSGDIEGGWQKTVKSLTNLTSEKKNKFEIIIVAVSYTHLTLPTKDSV